MTSAFSKRYVRWILLALTAAEPLSNAQAVTGPQVWIATWGASQQIAEPQNALPAADLRDATLRQVFHLSAGGAVLRVHLSNAFGAKLLHVTAAHIARPLTANSDSIDPATDKALMFAGAGDVTIPAGRKV